MYSACSFENTNQFFSSKLRNTGSYETYCIFLMIFDMVQDLHYCREDEHKRKTFILRSLAMALIPLDLRQGLPHQEHL